MNVVLYTQDFEPITVVDLPRWLLDKAERQGTITLGVDNKVSGKADTHILVYCKKLKWYDGSLKSVLLTADEVPALAIKPAWLPGQLQAVHGTTKLLRKLHAKVLELIRKN